MKLMYGLLITALALLALIVNCDVHSAQQQCARYAGKYKNEQTGKVSTCLYQEERNTLVCREEPSTVSIYRYRSLADFVAERNSFGRARYMSMEKRTPRWEFNNLLTYDKQGRLTEESSDMFSVIWKKWDEKGRTVAGLQKVHGYLDNITVSVSYNETKRTEIFSFSYPGESDLSGKLQSLPKNLSFTYDTFGNLIREESTLVSGEKSITVYKILEFKKACL